MSEFSAQDPGLLADFVTESRELIEAVDQDLVALEQNAGDADLLNRIFRALHTIKGASSFLALDPLTHFAHAGEDALNALRKGSVALDAAKMDLLLQAVDVIREQIESVNAGTIPADGPADLAAQLRAIGSGEDAAKAPAQKGGSTHNKAEAAEPLKLADSKRELLPFMMDDLLAGLDQVRQMLNAADPTVDGRTLATQFGDVTGGLLRSAEFINIDLLTADIRALDRLTDAVAEFPAEGRGEITAVALPLLQIIHDRAQAMRAGHQPTADSTAARDAIERLLSGEPPVESAKADAALPPDGDRRTGEDRRQGDRRNSDRNANNERTVRVDVERLESLLNLVGELVLQKNRVLKLSKLVRRSNCDQDIRDQLTQIGSEIERVTADLHSGVMKTRMQPLNKLFNRYPRLIRDLARSLNKQIDLQIEGGETEVDKSVIEVLGDPLVHILRNSADHGVEPAAEREPAGKSAEGVIRLSARHEGNHVMVQVADDGRGLDPDKLTAKAIEKGLITEEQRQSMTAREINGLIFEPGFSTAKQVSDVSGRGVGMDVVRTNITKLNGMVDVESELGKGTTITIRIPLTVAIMPAMMVKVASEVYAIPLNNIVEIIRPEPRAIRSVGGQPVLCVRDHVLPVLDMTRWLRASVAEQRPPIAVIVALGDKQLAMLVTGLLGQEEVVIKPLDESVDRDIAVSGATIREDGSVSLILDVAALFKALESRPLAAA